jgi:hypothetical protein
MNCVLKVYSLELFLFDLIIVACISFLGEVQDVPFREVDG